MVAHMAWQAAPLQFVAGLGPRKAQLLARTAQREQFVHTRLFLFRELGILGKAVFRQSSLQDKRIHDMGFCHIECPPLAVRHPGNAAGSMNLISLGSWASWTAMVAHT